MKKFTFGKRIIISLVLIIITAFIFIWFVNSYINSRFKPDSSTQSQKTKEITKTFTLEELKKYDGTNPNLPIYLALDGLVYDVTAGKKFYAPGGAYHSLAGKDSSALLHIAGGDIIKKKYPAVGKLNRAPELSVQVQQNL